MVDGKGSNDALLARVNTLREKPVGANRFFITDLNGPVYILDKDTKKFTTISTSMAVTATTPGPMMQFEEVLIEWTDTNPSNTMFEATARELLRICPNNRLHPLGDMTFNPAARQGDPDWSHVECGDGGSARRTEASDPIHSVLTLSSAKSCALSRI